MASLCSRHPRAVPPEQRGLRLRPCHRDAEALAAGQAQWRRPEGREQVGDVPLGHRASRGLSPLPAHLPAISPYREQGRGASRHVCRLLSADRRYGPPRRSGRRGRPGSRRRWRPRFRALRTPRWRSSLGAVRPSGRAPPASAPLPSQASERSPELLRAPYGRRPPDHGTSIRVLVSQGLDTDTRIPTHIYAIPYRYRPIRLRA